MTDRLTDEQVAALVDMTYDVPASGDTVVFADREEVDTFDLIDALALEVQQARALPPTVAGTPDPWATITSLQLQLALAHEQIDELRRERDNLQLLLDEQTWANDRD